jgi:hypothetical protein
VRACRNSPIAVRDQGVAGSNPLPDQHVSSRISFRIIWSGSGFSFAYTKASPEVFSHDFNVLRTFEQWMARSRRVAGSCSKLKERNLRQVVPT